MGPDRRQLDFFRRLDIDIDNQIAAAGGGMLITWSKEVRGGERRVAWWCWPKAIS